MALGHDQTIQFLSTLTTNKTSKNIFAKGHPRFRRTGRRDFDKNTVIGYAGHRPYGRCVTDNSKSIGNQMVSNR